jgi:hypothetical protein
MANRTQRGEREVRLAVEQKEKYLGAAKVNLSQLHFDTWPSLRPDPWELPRVEKKFRQAKLLRVKPENRVKGKVGRQDLNRALEEANTSLDSLRNSNPDDLPWLNFPNHELSCLQGRYRVEVGRAILPSYDQWWMVDLYLDGM